MSLKDFDFNPEVSTSDLVGCVGIMRELADTKLWKKKPFDVAHAIIDLHMLANTAPGEWKTEAGATVTYKAGWCIWSNRSLAERWGWRQESVESLLKQLEELGWIRRHSIGQRWKAIELVHWRSMDGASLEHGWSNDGDGRSRSKELGEGVGGGESPRVVTFETAWDYFQKNESGYTSDQVREQWLYYDAQRDPNTGEWRKPRGATGAMVPITDWRSELAAALIRFAVTPGEENKKTGAGGVSASVAAIQQQTAEKDLKRRIADLEEEIHQDRQSNLPYNGEKRARLKKLREELADENAA